MFRDGFSRAVACVAVAAFSVATVNGQQANLMAPNGSGLSASNAADFVGQQSEGSYLTEWMVFDQKDRSGVISRPARVSPLGSPRGVGLCDDIVYDSGILNDAVNTDASVFPAILAGGLFVGKGTQLAFTERAICEVSLPVSVNVPAGPDVVRSVTLRIYDACPSDAPGGDTCNAATLLHEEVANFSIAAFGNAAPDDFSIITFNVPNVIVPDTAYIMFDADPDVIGWIGINDPIIGDSAQGLTLCGNTGSTVNGCDQWGFGGPAGFSGQLILQVSANPTQASGACCLNAGGCTTTTVEDCTFTLFGTFFEGEDCNTFSCPAPCDIVQGMDDLVEGEGTCTDGDVYNAGCNSADEFGMGATLNGPTLTPSVPGSVSVFGTAGTPVVGGRDTDWYLLDLTGEVDETLIIVELESEFPGQILVFDSTDCLTNVAIGNDTSSEGCGSLATASVCLDPGQYYVFVSVNPANAFSFFVPPVICDGSSDNDDYRLTVTADPNCIEVACPAGTTGQISNLGGEGGGGTIAVATDFGFESAENFTPQAAGSVTGGTIYGLYFEAGFASCTEDVTMLSDNWVITYYQNDDFNGIPGTQIAQFTEGVDLTVTRTPTGRFDLAIGEPEVAITYSHAPVPVTSQNCHWVGLSSDAAAGMTDCRFFWLTAPAGDVTSAQRGDTAVDWESPDQLDHDLAGCVDIGGIATNIDGCTSATDFIGACCFPFGPCQETTLTNCLNQNGIFAGANTQCGIDTDCEGACCVPDLVAGTATCQQLTYQQCMAVSSGGSNFFAFLGVGTDCLDSPCATGSCCLNNGNCRDFATFAQITHRPNCTPQLISDEPGNLFDRSALNPPFGQIGGFTAGGACTGGFPDTECPQPAVFSAFNVGCNDSVTYNNAGLDEAGNSSGGTIDQPDHSCIGGGVGEGNGAYWLTFTASNAQTLISACATTAVNDTVLSVYTSTSFNPVGDISGPNGADFEIACNDDAANPCNGDAGNFNAELCIDTVPSQQYWIQVSSFTTADQGEITITITCADDACTAAPACATCTSDVDGDNDRDGADIQAFANELISPTPNLCADTDNSGTVDLGDITNFVTEVLAGGTCP